MKMLNGNISIHAQAGHRETNVWICIEDKDACVQILEMEMNMKDFAMAITGRGNTPMKFHLSDTSKVGMKHEVKNENVTFTYKNGTISKEEINKAIHKYEVDGWVGNRKDAKNYHNQLSHSASLTTYKISFHRWVE